MKSKMVRNFRWQSKTWVRAKYFLRRYLTIPMDGTIPSYNNDWLGGWDFHNFLCFVIAWFYFKDLWLLVVMASTSYTQQWLYGIKVLVMLWNSYGPVILLSKFTTKSSLLVHILMSFHLLVHILFHQIRYSWRQQNLHLQKF